MATGLASVQRFLVQHYDLDELRTLCFELGVNYDELAGATLSSKARELVLWAGRQRKLETLLATLRAARPAPFEAAGLDLGPAGLEQLYDGLAAYESSSAPQSWWTRFRGRPGVFYPALALVVLAALVIVASALVSIAGGAGGAQRQLQAWGVLSTPTSTPSPTSMPTPTLTATPTPTPLPFAPERSGEVLVVVAAFDEATGVVSVRAEGLIRQAIRAAADETGFADLRAEVEPARLLADDRAGAEELGKRYDATMVIWGEITGVRVTVNYLNRKQPDFDAAQVRIEETQRTQLANPSAYSSFITRDLPGQMTFLSLFAVGQSFVSQERYSDSIRAIEAAVAAIASEEAIEGLADAYFRLGWLYQSMPEPDNLRAIADYDKAIEINPDDADAYVNRGVARYHSDDLEEAIADFDKSIELDPDDADAYNNRGNARRKSGDLEGAIAEYDEAIELKPDYAEAYNNRGLARLVGGDLAGAMSDFDQAIDLRPDDADAYYNRGLTRGASGDLEGAIADYDKSIELDPDDAFAYVNRGNARRKSGDLAGAIIDYGKAIEIRPDIDAAYYGRGLAHYDSNDLAGAIADYNRVVELEPNAVAPLNSLCRAYVLQQQAEQALPYCERAVKIDPHPAFRDSRGVVYALLGRYEAAIKDFEASIAWLEQQPDAGNEEILARRKAWVEALRAGRNPFTPEVLADLRTE